MDVAVTGETGAPAIDALLGEDVIRLIAGARSIVDGHGDSIWPGFSDAPFQIVVTTEADNILICPEVEAEDFEHVGEDSITGCAVSNRPRALPYPALASFPSLSGHPTIVISPPEAIEHEPLTWTTTLLHEHFHQYRTALWKRSAMYAFGADEAEILERLRPGWREDYFTVPMQLGSHFGFAEETAGPG